MTTRRQAARVLAIVENNGVQTATDSTEAANAQGHEERGRGRERVMQL